ncbi:glycosyltransferase family 4 protein [Neptunomonas japonica]|uniref:Glycosyl transferase family 1 n=1 Tax=Neptunomonas japonica JAMM 1380 TaxID=1441457 RepID=A0A7R6SVH7_9GAMM|nr:glycosyltransferase family 4 protein [Neptunomonas japonica]BBB28755.1 glycosyl transferase family 1 [Neptunomonas japonica JAMM 1380]
MVNLLVVTTLFPNSVQHRHGIFVETRLKKIMETGQVNAVVVAPVPWFPIKSKYFSQYSQYVDIPSKEHRNGVEIYHPRYLVIPKVGMLLTPFFLALAIFLTIFKVRKQGYKFDLIDAHYFYPDGVAVALASYFLKLPFVISARGSDINLIPNYLLPRKMILWAASKAQASITVSSALKEKMLALGAVEEKIHVLRNGVDDVLFSPKNYQQMRHNYSLKRATLLSVGNLTELKGHDLVIKSLLELPDCELIIVGGGELDKPLKQLAETLGLSERVRFMGTLKQPDLVELYSAADLLVLASSREGWANVLLEAMACGAPVAATSVGGTPELVKSPEAGVLVKERNASGLVKAISKALSLNIDRDLTREYAKKFSWDQTVENQINLYTKIVESHA